MALEEIPDWHRENVYILPTFDLFAIYGVNPKLRGFGSQLSPSISSPTSGGSSNR